MIGRWWRDLAFGFRLAVGGSRGSATGWMRLAVGAVGVALAVVLLLASASIGAVSEQRSLRQAALTEQHQPREGVSPIHVRTQDTPYRGKSIVGTWVYPESADSPRYPGLSRHLKPGEVVVSPELARLLSSEQGERLRPRFDGLRRAGTIDKAGLVAPGDLRFVVGADADIAGVGVSVIVDDESAMPLESSRPVYGFGGLPYDAGPLPTELVMLAVVGTVALLVPLLIFVVSSTRIAGAERDRRLAALRLVGGDTRQVRRIAAAEALLPAFAGLALGGVLFFALRPLAERLRLFGTSVFAEGLAPSPLLTGLIVLGVPVIAVATAMVTLRRTVIEPLGVARQANPRRRRLWWRIATLAAGIGLLLNPRDLVFRLPEVLTMRLEWTDLVIAGACLMLVGVAMLLPWAVEAVIGRLRGGSPSWQLAIRRLQLDSGTSARVISGVVVVLTGGIALQVTMTSIGEEMRQHANSAIGGYAELRRGVMIRDSDPRLDGVQAQLRGVAGVTEAHRVSWGHVGFRRGDEPSGAYAVVADCAILAVWSGIGDCQDGDVFLYGGHNEVAATGPESVADQMVRPGDRLTLDTSGAAWQVPEDAREFGAIAMAAPYPADVLLTPGARAGSPLATVNLPSALFVAAGAGMAEPVDMEQLRNAIGLRSPQPMMIGGADTFPVPSRVQDFIAIKSVLLAGSVFVLLVASLSVLMMSVEQVRERRRALAAIAAGGVGFTTLARSLLWQNAVPLGVGGLLSTAGGGVLAFLVLQLTNTPIYTDVVTYAAMLTTTAALVLFVTLLSMPMLRAAVSVKNLRTE